MDNQWERFFDGYAPQYMQEGFTSDTVAEVDFMLEELSISSGSNLLDIGCGTGRHAIELAKRGHHVTGVDISAGMLAEAKKTAEVVGVTVEWIHQDATKFTPTHQYDAVYSLCEGAFCLLGLGSDPFEHELALLRNVYSALKPGSTFILTALNGMRLIRQYTQQDVIQRIFDPMILAETHSMEWDTPQGKQMVTVRERGYVPSELRLLFRFVGLNVKHIWGGTAGTPKRRPIDLDEIELMIIGTKPLGDLNV